MNKILICAPVRQKPEILTQYLQSLDSLVIPDNVSINRYFILHNCYDYIHKYFNSNDILIDYSDISNDVRNKGKSHDWQIENFKAVVFMKNKIKDYALKYDYDYIFMVDSDLILHEETLKRLYYFLDNSNEKAIGNVFYTDWNKSGCMLPNAWDTDQYGFMQNPEHRYKSDKTEIYQVGGTGACILIKTDIFKNQSINYNFIQNISFSYWEDRAFCIRCYVNGIKIFLDTKYPCKHLYHD